jgi:spoIIIJ-associated protein
METENQIKIISTLLEELLEKMTVIGQVECSEMDGGPVFTIKTREAGILIGEDGKHLIALSHIVKKMAENKLKKDNLDDIPFLLDVNDYQMKRIEELRNIARMSAQRVIFFKKELEMEPMSAYDRRIIHSVLGGYPDIKTESVGEGFDRRVVIKPIG